MPARAPAGFAAKDNGSPRTTKSFPPQRRRNDRAAGIHSAVCRRRGNSGGIHTRPNLAGDRSQFLRAASGNHVFRFSGARRRFVPDCCRGHSPASHDHACASPCKKAKPETPAMTRRIRQKFFLFSAAALALCFVWGYRDLPPFGQVTSIYADKVNAITVPQRHITDAVTAVNFDIRGFDTLG